jgi:hypothetical protein
VFARRVEVRFHVMRILGFQYIRSGTWRTRRRPEGCAKPEATPTYRRWVGCYSCEVSVLLPLAGHTREFIIAYAKTSVLPYWCPKEQLTTTPNPAEKNY